MTLKDKLDIMQQRAIEQDRLLHIDLEYIDYVDGDKVGTFNLNNFERC